jgi:uncharacterized protein YjbJ (UPF0337 family)
LNKDQVKGSIKDAAGKMQRKTGEAFGNANQEAKGLAKQAEGKTEKAAGDARKAVKDSVKK